MVEIVGHTDSTLPSAQARFRDNWSLSSARAGAVARVLLENGIPRTSLNIKGMADLQPMADESVNDPIQKSTNRSKNRRVHIIVKKVETKL
jgi:chemotaxis protein MotB